MLLLDLQLQGVLVVADALSMDLCFSTALCRIQAASWQPRNGSGEVYIGASLCLASWLDWEKWDLPPFIFSYVIRKTQPDVL